MFQNLIVKKLNVIRKIVLDLGGRAVGELHKIMLLSKSGPEPEISYETYSIKEFSEFATKRSTHLLTLSGTVVFLLTYAIHMAKSVGERMGSLFLLFTIVMFLGSALHVMIMVAQYFLGLGKFLGILGTRIRPELLVKLEVRRYNHIISLISFYLVFTLFLAAGTILFHVNAGNSQEYFCKVLLVPNLLTLMFVYVKIVLDEDHHSTRRLLLLWFFENTIAVIMAFAPIGNFLIFVIELILLVCFQLFEDRKLAFCERMIKVRRLGVKLGRVAAGFTIRSLIAVMTLYIFEEVILQISTQVVVDDTKIVGKSGPMLYTITVIGNLPPDISYVKVNGALVNEHDMTLVGTVSITDNLNTWLEFLDVIGKNTPDRHSFLINLAPYTVKGKNVIQIGYERRTLFKFLPRPPLETISSSFLVTE